MTPSEKDISLVMQSVISCDAEGNIYFANDGVSALLGYTSKELVNQNLLQFLLPPYHVEFEVLLRATDDVLRELGCFAVYLRDKNGQSIPARLSVIRMDEQAGHTLVIQISGIEEESCNLTFFEDGGLVTPNAGMFRYENTTGVNVRQLFPTLEDHNLICEFLEKNHNVIEGCTQDGTRMLLRAVVQKIQMGQRKMFRGSFTQLDSQEALILLGADNRVTECDQLVTELFGQKPEALHHQDITTLVPGFTLINDRSLKRQRTDEVQLQLLHGNTQTAGILGEGIPISWRLLVIEGANARRGFALRIRRVTGLQHNESTRTPEIQRHSLSLQRISQLSFGSLPTNVPSPVLSDVPSFSNLQLSVWHVGPYEIGTQIGSGASSTVKFQVEHSPSRFDMLIASTTTNERKWQ